MAEQSSGTTTTAGALKVERLFDAPRELVWKAWSDPAHLTQWWGPKGYTGHSVKVDFRVGGTWLACMRSPEGQDIWATGVYREIVQPERIVATDSFADENGNVVPASHYGIPGDFPDEMLITVTLEDRGGKTFLTLIHEGLGEMAEGAGQGWNESFDKLAASLR